MAKAASSLYLHQVLCASLWQVTCCDVVEARVTLSAMMVAPASVRCVPGVGSNVQPSWEVALPYPCWDPALEEHGEKASVVVLKSFLLQSHHYPCRL